MPWPGVSSAILQGQNLEFVEENEFVVTVGGEVCAIPRVTTISNGRQVCLMLFVGLVNIFLHCRELFAMHRLLLPMASLMLK